MKQRLYAQNLNSGGLTNCLLQRLKAIMTMILPENLCMFCHSAERWKSLN